MSRRWTVLDVNNLAWKAFHSTGHLKNERGASGVLFGLMRDIWFLHRDYPENHFVFCFDSGPSLRKKIHPEYKNNRKTPKSMEEQEDIDNARIQIDDLRKRYLSELGQKNVLFSEGFEADDIIASVVRNMNENDEALIVSGDHDLYQLLSKNVSIYQPIKKEIVTPKSFKDKYGIPPFQWTMVKAIAGCSSDNIHGIRGVGEDTAIKYIKGELPEHYSKHQSIKDGNKVIAKNFQLVKLPMTGTPKFTIKECEWDQMKWGRLMEDLEFHSLGGIESRGHVLRRKNG